MGNLGTTQQGAYYACSPSNVAVHKVQPRGQDALSSWCQSDRVTTSSHLELRECFLIGFADPATFWKYF